MSATKISDKELEDAINMRFDGYPVDCIIVELLQAEKKIQRLENQLKKMKASKI
jgi:hypothetical protein